MSHSTSRTKRSPISSYIQSLKTSEEASTTAYFKSKLFRGKSISNVSGHLHSLRELNSLKANHNLHTLSYIQLNKLIPPTNQTGSLKKNGPKVKSTSVVPTSLRGSYISLNPEELQEDLPKKREKHSLPSEQRQILIQRYQLQSETLHTGKPLNTLDYIWHETLTNTVGQDNQPLRTSVGGTKGEFIAINDMLKNTYAQNTERWPNYIREGTKGPHFINKAETAIGKSDSDMFIKKSMTSEGPYGLTTKQMESLMNSLKDFHKLLSYTQQSYQKAQAQQTHLGNFVSTFIKEVDQIEKLPKTLNASRLNLCVTSLENKIDELSNEKELVKEQLTAIRALIDGKVPVNNNKSPSPSPSPLLFNERKPSLKGYGSSIVSLNCSQNTRPGSAIPFNASQGPRSSMGETVDGNDERIGSARDRLSLDHLQTKTRQLKTEVAKLQQERLSYQEGRKTVKVKILKRKLTEESPRRLPTGFRNFNDSPDSEFSYKMDLSPTDKLSIPVGLMPLNEPTPKEDEGDELNNHVDGTLDINGEQSPKEINRHSRKGETLSSVDEMLKKHPEAESDSALILYEIYSKALTQLEEKLRKRLGEMKLFQKDVDEVYTSNTKLLTLQINYCFENLANEFQSLSKDFESRGKVFLRAVAENYERFLKLNDSNLLKLTSVKNIVVSSVKKLKKLERFCSKFSQLDLTDRSLRKTFDERNQKLKLELQGDRKTLLFLTEQFNNSISMYQLDAMQDPSAQDVWKLVEQSRMLLRVLYNLEKFPALEDDFNEKSTTAYNKCKVAAELVVSLREFYKAGGMMPAEQYKEAEDCVKSLESLHVRLFALQNEMTMLSKLGIFEDTVKKPLLIVTKLVKKMGISHKELKELLDRIKEDLIVDYRDIIRQSEDVEHQLEGHMKRILQNREHLNFYIWTPNYMIIEGLREELIKTTVEVARYVEERYPPSIALIPKPQEKLNDLQNLEKVVDSLLKTIETGKLFESWQSKEVFEGLSTNTLGDKLKETYDRIQEEIRGKEKILLNTEKASELFNRIVGEVLEVLMQLRFILNKTFELEDQINGQYQSFQEEHMGNGLYLLNPSAVLEKHKEKYPRFFSQMTIENYDFLNSPMRDATSPSTAKSQSPGTFMRWKSLKRQFTMGLVKMLPELENTEGEYPNKMTGFIEKMKGVFGEYCGNTLTPYSEQHFIFKEFYNKLKEVCNGEISLLEKAQRAVYNVQVNHIFYNREIRPLTHLHKYLYVLNNWTDKIGGLTSIKESMNACLKAVTDLEEEGILRGGIEIQVVKYRQIQTMLCNSINIIIDLLTLGAQLNDREINGHLGHSLRVEEGGLGDFIKSFNRKFRALYNSYEANSDMVEEDTGKLVENLQEFVEILLSALSLAQEQYIQLFRTVSDGLRPHDGDFLSYIGKIYTDMKEFSDEFRESLEEISKLSTKSTWLAKTLDVFYKNIVLKDIAVFSRLYDETKKLSDFINQIKSDFINKDIKEEAKYKNTDDSNPTQCDRYAARCDILYKTLNEFCGIEEIICRPELKSIIGVKLKEVQSMRKGMVIFAIVYSMGRKLNDSANAMIEKTSMIDIYESLVKLDDTVGEMLKHLYREVEEAKALDRDFSALTMSVNLELILKEEILVFYLGTKKFLEQLKEYLSGIYQFYQELKKKYKDQVLLLRDDWIGLIKEWVPKHFISPKKKIAAMKTDYVQFANKMNKFVDKLQVQIKSDKSTLTEVMNKVEYLNEYFLNDWFFNSTEEEREAADKLFAVVHKLAKNTKQKKYKTAAKLRQKVTKIGNLIENCSKCVRDLSDVNLISPCFKEIRGWSNVIEHYNKQNIGAWKDVIAFVQTEVLAFNDEQEEKSKIREQAQTAAELYVVVEQKLGCKLTEVQQEFLEAIFTFV